MKLGAATIMEKEGLERVLGFLQQQRLKVDVLVTDSHRQIKREPY